MKNITLTEKQLEVFKWLSNQRLNTDSDTLIFWSKKYPEKRLKEVVRYALARQQSGEKIRNIGGWIQNILKKDILIINEDGKLNGDIAKAFVEVNKWGNLKIYEKYVKDEVTQDDLSLTMPVESFKRSLEALYLKSKLYDV